MGLPPRGAVEVMVIARNGMIAGRAPLGGREKAGESSSLSSPSSLGELITGQQPTAQVSAWDQPPAHPRTAHSASPGKELNKGWGRVLGERHFRHPHLRAHN